MGSAVLARARKSLRSFHAPARENSGCAQACETLAFEGWKAIVERRQLIAPCGSEIPLTGGEFKLLSAFLKNPGRVLSRQQLIDVTVRDRMARLRADGRRADFTVAEEARGRSEKTEIAEVSARRRLRVYRECVAARRAEKLTIGFPISQCGSARASAFENFCHLAVATFLGERERHIAGAIGDIDIGTCIDERLEGDGVTLAAVTEDN